MAVHMPGLSVREVFMKVLMIGLVIAIALLVSTLVSGMEREW